MKRGKSSRIRLVVVLAFTISMTVLALGWLNAQQYDKAQYVQVNLVSTGYVSALVIDPNLVNPWGVSAGPTTPVWISNQGTNTSTLYTINNIQNGIGSPFVVGVPTTGTSADQGPTGQVFNGGTGFRIPAPEGATVPSRFIFANLNGTISGWNSGSTGGAANAVIAVSNPGAVYTGLAMGTVGSNTYLYAADFNPPPDGGIKVFDSSFNAVDLGPDAFIDPQLPPLPADEVWAPTNVANLGGTLFVAYAPMPVDGGPPIPGLHNGVIGEFTTAGAFIINATERGLLNDPWGMVMAPPDNFGRFSNDLLVGNFGDGKIVGFWPIGGGRFNYAGLMGDTHQRLFRLGALWSLWFGNGASGADQHTLYFTTGGPNFDRSFQTPPQDGLFGAITPLIP
jgi:uncharacterized protein (TIGR03118 family)